MSLLFCLLLIVTTASAALTSCSLTWVPVTSEAYNTQMTVGSYRFSMTFSGTVSIDGTVPTSDFSTTVNRLIMLFTISDSASGTNVTTMLRRAGAMARSSWLDSFDTAKSVTIVSGSSLLLEPPLYFKENATYTITYTKPPVSTTSMLFIGGVAESSFSCSATMDRVPRMYHMTQIQTACAAGDYTNLVTPLFVFSEPVGACGTGARFSSANVRSYDGFAYSCPLWSYADGGRIWWCASTEPGLELGGNLWRYDSVDVFAIFKPVEFVSVCTLNGNIPIVADDFIGRAKGHLITPATATCSDLSERMMNMVMNLTYNSVHAILPVRSWRGPVNASLSTIYYKPPGGFTSGSDVQTFPSRDYAALINALRSGSSFYPSVSSYQFTVAGPGYVVPAATESNSTVNSVPATISRVDVWMEYRSELGYFAMVCRVYTTTWIGQSIGIRLVTPQAPTVDRLASGTLELDTTAQIYNNAYRTIRSNLNFLPSGMQAYLSHTGTGLYAFVRLVNVSALDATPLTLSSVTYGTIYTSLLFTFAGCHLELLNVSFSRISVSACTLASTYTLVSPCVFEVAISGTTLCQISTVTVLYDAVWTTQQVSPYSYTSVAVGASPTYSAWPMQAVAVYAVDHTRLFIDLANVTSSGATVQVDQLSLSCGTVTSGVFYYTQHAVELTVTGCTAASSATLTVGALAITSATQNVFPVSLAVQFLSPYAEPAVPCANYTFNVTNTYVETCQNFTFYVNTTTTETCQNQTFFVNTTTVETCQNLTFYVNNTYTETCQNFTFYVNTTTTETCQNQTFYVNTTTITCQNSSTTCECTLADVSLPLVLAISIAPALGVLLVLGLMWKFK